MTRWRTTAGLAAYIQIEAVVQRGVEELNIALGPLAVPDRVNDFIHHVHKEVADILYEITQNG